MNRFLLITLALTSLLTTSCIKNKFSYHRKGEEVVINFQHERNNHRFIAVSSVPMMELAENTRGIGMIVAPYLLKTGYDVTRRVMDKRNEKAVGKYSAFNSDDKFYRNLSATTSINLKSIDIIRFVETNQSEQDTASLVKFKIETSADGKFMRLVPYELMVNYSKARMDLFDKNIDMNMVLSIDASWVDSDMEQNITEIFRTEILFRNILLRKKYNEKDLSKYKTTWMPLIPRSYLTEETYGYGNFTFKANVTEYDDYNKRVKDEFPGESRFYDYVDQTKDVIDNIKFERNAQEY